MKTTAKTVCSEQSYLYLLQLCAGMFAGLLVLAAVASCVGLADNIFEMANLLFVCMISSSTLTFANRLFV